MNSEQSTVNSISMIVETLLSSDEPAIWNKALVNLLGRDPQSMEVRQAREQVRSSKRVINLLSQRTAEGTIPFHPYAKWNGAHWVLAALAEIGYPPGDESLVPLREQVLDWLLGNAHTRYIQTIAGKVRRCASQEGNALYALLSLGLADERCDELARRMVKWQWPDGGWNCDKRPEAQSSSFMESLIPLRALALYTNRTGDSISKIAVERAVEVFLSRHLFKRRTDGSLIHPDFIRLHYPCYWHYDILFGLKVLAETGEWIGEDFIHDERCREARQVLDGKRLPDDGFPAEAKFYRVGESASTGRSLVDWGVTSLRKMNPFVTVDALYVLSKVYTQRTRRITCILRPKGRR